MDQQGRQRGGEHRLPHHCRKERQAPITTCARRKLHGKHVLGLANIPTQTLQPDHIKLSQRVQHSQLAAPSSRHSVAGGVRVPPSATLLSTPCKLRCPLT